MSESKITIDELIDKSSATGGGLTHIPLPEEMLERRRQWADFALNPGSAEAYRRELLKADLKRRVWRILGLMGLVALLIPSVLILRRLADRKLLGGKPTPVPTVSNNPRIAKKTPKVGVRKDIKVSPNPVVSGPVVSQNNNASTSNVGTEKSSRSVQLKQSRQRSLRTRRVDANNKIARLETPEAPPFWEMVNDFGMEFALIPSGSFLMGGDPGDPNSVENDTGIIPQHPVTISRPFYLGVFEVTREEYQRLKGEWRGDSRSSVNTPVEATWYEAVEFCNALSVREGLPPYYRIQRSGVTPIVLIEDLRGLGYRLPTEAEWEYACRANGPPPFVQTFFSFGSDPNNLIDYGWFLGNSPNQTKEVGLLLPNRFHLHDMHGNVLEWCWDWHDRDYYKRRVEIDPMGPETGTNKVRRGGAITLDEAYAHSAFRTFTRPTTRFYDIGFRVAKNTQ